MKINIDCKHYLGYKPCDFHKLDGRLCEDCPDYRKTGEKILIVKLDALGDVLRTTSILPALHRKYKEPAITWITRKSALPLLENNPYTWRAFAVEENYLEFVQNESFDVGICLDADPLSTSILSIAKCYEKMGFGMNQWGQVVPQNLEAEKWLLMGLNDQMKKKNRESYQKNIYEICKLNSHIDKPQIFMDGESLSFARRFYEAHHLSAYKKIVGINTGGGNRWQLKKWTMENYIQLVLLLKKTPENIGIILLGGPEEIEFNKKIKEKLGDLLIDTGCHNSLMEFSALINLVDVFFTPDSLGMHIAIALNKTTVVIVGPTSPWELDVYGNGEIIYNEELDCISCYQPTCDKKFNCMNSLKPERIFESIMRYI